jgi:hypothetical protein
MGPVGRVGPNGRDGKYGRNGTDDVAAADACVGASGGEVGLHFGALRAWLCREFDCDESAGVEWERPDA